VAEHEISEPTEFEGEIRVAARVIDFLSSGLYKNAAACMKELINNSYDADATEVTISVKPDADLIAIEDNGAGLTREQFVTHFSRVAESHKRDDGERTARGREKIGKIGIGFIAANELCDQMEIFSTCENSTEILHVNIDFGKIRDRSFSTRREQGGDVHKGDYHGEITHDADAADHYTKVYLKRIRETAIDSFVSEADLLGSPSPKSVYGLHESSVLDLLSDLDSWDQMDLYSQTRARIGLNVPVRYLAQWAPSELTSGLSPFTRRAFDTGFKVVYDGTELTKPIVLVQRRNRSLIRELSMEGEHIRVSGYLFASHGALKPKELNGVLIRIRDSAVGEYDATYLGYPQQINALFRGWVSGELYVDGALDEALNIDRQTLRDTHPAYVELRKWFLGELANFFKSVREEMYTQPAERRQQERVQAEKLSFSEITQRVKSAYGEAAASELAEAWDQPAAPQRGRPRRSDLSKSFSVNEIYEIALDVAQSVLSPESAAAYIAELTRRLRG
jgi:hypothetical protein